MRQLTEKEIKRIVSAVSVAAAIFDFLDGDEVQDQPVEPKKRMGRKPKIITARCEDCLHHKTMTNREFLDYACAQCGSTNLSKT